MNRIREINDMKLVIMFTHTKDVNTCYNKYNLLVDYDIIGCEVINKYIEKLNSFNV